MDKKKSQAYNFAHEVLPIMFHSQTNDFFQYLEKDGLKFLEFWWNYIGDQLPEEQRRPFTGMTFEFLPEEEKIRKAIITLPHPREEGEIYYMAVVAKPERRFAWVKLPNTRVIVLSKRDAPENPNGTEVGDITPRGIYVRSRKGPEPTLSNMKKTVAISLKPPSS
jgi:hypothetical protein